MRFDPTQMNRDYLRNASIRTEILNLLAPLQGWINKVQSIISVFYFFRLFAHRKYQYRWQATFFDFVCKQVFPFVSIDEYYTNWNEFYSNVNCHWFIHSVFFLLLNLRFLLYGHLQNERKKNAQRLDFA